MTRSRTVLSFSLLTAVACAGLWLGTAHAAGDDVKKCTTKKFATEQVKKACKEGGQKAAKDLMKKVVKKAKKDGKDIGCKDCHKSLKTFDLEDGAVGKLKKLL